MSHQPLLERADTVPPTTGKRHQEEYKTYSFIDRPYIVCSRIPEPDDDDDDDDDERTMRSVLEEHNDDDDGTLGNLLSCCIPYKIHRSLHCANLYCAVLLVYSPFHPWSAALSAGLALAKWYVSVCHRFPRVWMCMCVRWNACWCVCVCGVYVFAVARAFPCNIFWPGLRRQLFGQKCKSHIQNEIYGVNGCEAL